MERNTQSQHLGRDCQLDERSRTSGEAVQCLRAAEPKGMSVDAGARAHGCDGRSLHAWQMNVARRSGTTAPFGRRKTLQKVSPTAHARVELVPPCMPGSFGRSSMMVAIHLGPPCRWPLALAIGWLHDGVETVGTWIMSRGQAARAPARCRHPLRDGCPIDDSSSRANAWSSTGSASASDEQRATDTSLRGASRAGG